MRSARTVVAQLACVLTLAASERALAAETTPVSENAMKAVLFYKLPQFVYLPEARRNKAIQVCVLGSNPIAGALEKLAQSPPDNRAMIFTALAGVTDAGRCDYLFITRSESASYEAILHRLDMQDVVTVSDITGFARAGGMIEFAPNPERNGVQILINRRAARAHGIEFNAQLLRLARIVEP
jgi:hypothetical protein